MKLLGEKLLSSWCIEHGGRSSFLMKDKHQNCHPKDVVAIGEAC